MTTSAPPPVAPTTAAVGTTGTDTEAVARRVRDTVVSFNGVDPTSDIKLTDLFCIIGSAHNIFKAQDPYLHLAAPILVCGDIHGQLTDLLRVFKAKNMPSDDNPYLFLGDYVDRGDHSVPVIALLFALKVLHPYSVFLLRGNHECPEINDHYGFKDECVQRYGNVDGNQLWNKFNAAFQWLPIAASIENRIFCVHGGLSPKLTTGIDAQLAKIDRSALATVPSKGLVCDLMWSDPDRNSTGWEDNERGCGYVFDAATVRKFCEDNDFDLICRAHQCVDYGYDFFSKRKLVTVFTASNYCGSYNNCGAVLCVPKNLNCGLHVLRPNGSIEEESVDLSVKEEASTPPVTPRAFTPPPSPPPPAASTNSSHAIQGLEPT